MTFSVHFAESQKEVDDFLSPSILLVQKSYHHGVSAFSRVLFLTGVLLSSCATQPGLHEQKEAQVRFELGSGFFEDGRYPDSIQQFELALSKDPRRNDIKMMLGMSYFKMEKYKKAEELILEACLNEKTPYPECWNNLAAVYLKDDKPTQAVDAANKALAIDTYPTPEMALGNLALAEVKLNQLSAAQAAIEKAMRFNPDNCLVRVVFTKVLIGQKVPEAALRETKTSIAHCPLMASAHLWQAYVYYKLGQRANAETKYKEIINTFRRGEAVDESRLALEKLHNRIPLKEPAI